MALQDLIGKTFSRLTVIERAESTRYSANRIKTNWLCRCSCGNTVIARADQLKSGHTKSCGCIHSEWSKSGNARRSHGYTPAGNHSSEYNIWTGIKARCLNNKHPAYKNYGGRGIYICDRWINSFQSFIDDMGERPSKAHTIDRTNNDGPYSPENCKWATRDDQGKNKRNNIYISANRKTMHISAWARLLKINPQTLERRYHAGWPHEDIVNKPVRRPPSSR